MLFGVLRAAADTGEPDLAGSAPAAQGHLGDAKVLGGRSLGEELRQAFSGAHGHLQPPEAGAERA